MTARAIWRRWVVTSVVLTAGVMPGAASARAQIGPPPPPVGGVVTLVLGSPQVGNSEVWQDEVKVGLHSGRFGATTAASTRARVLRDMTAAAKAALVAAAIRRDDARDNRQDLNVARAGHIITIQDARPDDGGKRGVFWFQYTDKGAQTVASKIHFPEQPRPVGTKPIPDPNRSRETFADVELVGAPSGEHFSGRHDNVATLMVGVGDKRVRVLTRNYAHRSAELAQVVTLLLANQGVHAEYHAPNRITVKVPYGKYLRTSYDDGGRFGVKVTHR